MPVSNIMKEQFQKICQEIKQEERQKNGIGTLKEKTVHAVLKRYYEPEEQYQEIRIGNFVADICRDEQIIEIQTRSFDAMRKKLSFFLENYPVTIVYPIIHTKWLYWIDEDTGEVTKKRKSPKTGTPCDAFYELYKIKPFLTHPNLKLRLVLIDAEEYRLLNGWSHDRKRGSTRYDRIPTDIVEEYLLSTVEDYHRILPDGLPHPFTSKDFAASGKISTRSAQRALNILTALHTVKRAGKQGNAILYE